MAVSFARMKYAVVIMILCFWAPGLCGDNNTVQGNDIIIGMTEKFTGILETLKKNETGTARRLLTEAGEAWTIFLDHEAKFFGNEITQPDSLQAVMPGLKDALGKAVQAMENGANDELVEKIKVCLELSKSILKLISVPVLLDFTGGKCKACKVMKVRLNRLAADYQGVVRIAIVDVNKAKDLTRAYKVMLIPTLVFIDVESREKERTTGEIDENLVREKINSMIKE